MYGARRGKGSQMARGAAAAARAAGVCWLLVVLAHRLPRLLLAAALLLFKSGRHRRCRTRRAAAARIRAPMILCICVCFVACVRWVGDALTRACVWLWLHFAKNQKDTGRYMHRGWTPTPPYPKTFCLCVSISTDRSIDRPVDSFLVPSSLHFTHTQTAKQKEKMASIEIDTTAAPPEAITTTDPTDDDDHNKDEEKEEELRLYLRRCVRACVPTWLPIYILPPDPPL